MEFLTIDQLEKMRVHIYKAEGKSMLEYYIQPFWNHLLKYVPPTWAPNAMTLAGLTANGLSCLILLLLSPDGRSDVPSVAFFFAAWCLFLYQCLDALDGKQARKIGAANPLGELFDHGCDAVSTGFVALSLAVSLQLGNHQGTLFAFGISAPLIYYCFHWRAYCSGKLQFGYLDVTEAQWLSIFIFVTRGTFGDDFWSAELFGIQLKMLLLLVYFTYCFYFLANILYHIIVVGGCGRNYTTVANSSVLSPFPPLFFVLALIYKCRFGSHEDLYERLPLLFLSCYMIIVAKLSCRLIVAMMTKSTFAKFDSSMLALVLILASEYVPTSLLPESTGLFLAVMYALVDFFKYSTSVCRQIADYLGVYCLSLEKPPATRSLSGNGNTNNHGSAASSATSQPSHRHLRSSVKS